VPRAEPRALPSPRFRLGAWAFADIGSLPQVDLGAAIAAQIVLPLPLRFELGGGFLPPRTVDLARPQGAGGRILLGFGLAGACYDVLPSSSVELSPCLGYELGDLHATGFGVTTPGSGDQVWSALRPGLVFSWAPIRQLAIAARVEAVVPFDRETFVLSNVGSVWRPNAVAGRLGLGLELHL
jgi:hypothetical protein